MGIISEKITQILEEAVITRAIISKPSSKSSEYRKIDILVKEKTSAGNECKTCPPDRLYQISKYTQKQVFHENVQEKELAIRTEQLINELSFRQMSAWTDEHEYIFPL